jgi:hypothetical protein
MSDFNTEKFKEYWRRTEVIREYRCNLHTFGDTKLPYVFAAEHHQFKDRTLVRKGVIVMQKPHILLPRQYTGMDFEEGFEHGDAIPPEAVYLFRTMALPYSHITNKPLVEEQLEYGGLNEVIGRLATQIEEQENSEMGLIKGLSEGADVSLMRYTVGLMAKSASGNVKDFFEHLRRQRGEAIRADEKITDEDIKKLFG